MKLVIAVVQNEDADSIVESLLERQFRATRLASTGGFLRRGNTTLLIGVEDHDVETVLDVIRTRARTRIRQGQRSRRGRECCGDCFRDPPRRLPAPLRRTDWFHADPNTSSQRNVVQRRVLEPRWRRVRCASHEHDGQSG
jgi:uncharacterized protein YaaQ